MGESSQAATGSHAADEDTLIHGQPVHADAVSQDCTAGKGACGIHRNNAHGLALAAIFLRNLVCKGTLSCTGRACDAKHIGISGVRIEFGHDFRGLVVFILNGRDCLRQSQPIALQKFLHDIHSFTTFYWFSPRKEDFLLIKLKKMDDGSRALLSSIGLLFGQCQAFTFALMKSTTSEVGVPGVNTSATPASLRAGMSPSGITPPPMISTSFMPFSRTRFTTFGKRCG